MRLASFLGEASPRDLYVTDFAFHSICVILSWLSRTNVLVDFVKDVFVDGGVSLVSIKPNDTQDLVNAILAHKLDFDDAYQYLAAKQNDLVLVSFDADFDEQTTAGKHQVRF